jgi:ferredoxin
LTRKNGGCILDFEKFLFGVKIMTMKITEDCIACGACVPECPTESISEGDGITYLISQETCVECEGHYDSPKCVTVCPVDCIVKAN